MRIASPSTFHRALSGGALGAALMFGACSDSTGPGDHEDAAGVRAVMGGATLVNVNADRQVTGAFTVAVNEETDHITIQFLNDEGNPITVDPNSFYLRVQVANSALLEVEQDTPGDFGIHLHGLAAGSTTVQLLLMHGKHPGGHPDYTSPNIPVTVTP